MALNSYTYGIAHTLGTTHTLNTMVLHMHILTVAAYLCRFINELGSGQFGTVNKGVWRFPGGTVEVAVKTLNDEASQSDVTKFLQEAAVYGQFKHRNIVELLGVVTIGKPVS